MKMNRIALMFLAFMALLSSALSVTAATAAGFSGLSSIEALIWDLFSVMVPIAIALACLSILALAVPGLRKFLGGLLN